MKRRSWLLGTALAGASVPLAYVYATRKRPRAGPPDPALSVLSGPLSLRPGFSCIVLSRSGEILADGSRSADAPDGMACFSDPAGNWVLLRNHELHAEPRRGAYPEGNPQHAYDPLMHGGVSRLVLRPSDLRVLSSNSVLTGTCRNCGGGASPWGWLSCEESEDQGHGYVFSCPPDAHALLPPRRIPAYGRFRHEAVAVDPRTLRAYLTEDQFDGCLYRFSPKSRDDPFSGQLEALRLQGGEDATLRRLPGLGQRVRVDWVPIGDPEARIQSTREQALAQGAARFSRGEGAIFEGRSVAFAATSGGPAGFGQIFRLHLGGANEPDQLELVAQATDAEGLRGPDNLTVAPWGDLIIAEDGPSDQHLWGLDAQGQLYVIARNVQSIGEFAGVCFSPDGGTLFCNLQKDGWTVAIRGPWDTLSPRA